MSLNPALARVVSLLATAPLPPPGECLSLLGFPRMNRGPLGHAPIGPVGSSPLAVTVPCSSAPRASHDRTVNVWGTDALFQRAPHQLPSLPPYVSLDQDLGHSYRSCFSGEGAT